MDIRELYKELASTLYAYQECKKRLNTIWEKIHKVTIEELIKKLPHGSGIDGDYWFNWEANPNKYIQFGNQFHLMNEHGYYDGWVDFYVTVYPHLFLGIDIRITGMFPKKYQDVKENLYQVYQ